MQVDEQALQIPVRVLHAYGQCRERMQRHLRVLEKRYNLTLYLGDEGTHRIGRGTLGRGREHRVFPVERRATAAGEFQVRCSGHTKLLANDGL